MGGTWILPDAYCQANTTTFQGLLTLPPPPPTFKDTIDKMIPFTNGTITPVAAVAALTAQIIPYTDDLWIIIALAIGIPLAFYILKKVVALVRERAR